MEDLKKINWLGKLIFLILSLSLMLGFYLQEDVSTGGAAHDFYHFVWKFTLALSENFFYTYVNWQEAHLPFHTIILSIFNFLLNDEKAVRFLYCLISLFVPLIFYLNLKTRFNDKNNNLLLIFASILFILPVFRYTSILANFQMTAVIFFLISIFFFLKWSKLNSNQLDINLILQILFMTLAVYTRADYVLFFLYFMIVYLQKLKFKDFLKLSILVFILSLHGLWFVNEHFVTFSNIKFTPKFQNYLLVNSSIMFFYLFPIFLSLLIDDSKVFKKDIKFFIISIFIFSILVYFFSSSFNYNYSMGGGFLLKLSLLILNNKLLFFTSSMLGFVLLAYLARESLNNLLMILLILFGYSSSVIFQKYFEPTFLIIFFLLLQSKIPDKFLKNYKNIFFLYIYFSTYLLSSFINNIFEFSKNL